STTKAGAPSGCPPVPSTGPVRSLPLEPIFDRAAARQAGWSDSALTRAARSERIIWIRRGRYSLATAEALDPITQARAAALACTGSVVSHHSAALLHGLPLLN